MAHDQHDEQWIRAHAHEYQNSLCSDSIEAPKHGPAVDLTTLRGSFGNSPRRTANTKGRGSYR